MNKQQGIYKTDNSKRVIPCCLATGIIELFFFFQLTRDKSFWQGKKNLTANNFTNQEFRKNLIQLLSFPIIFLFKMEELFFLLKKI